MIESEQMNINCVYVCLRYWWCRRRRRLRCCYIDKLSVLNFQSNLWLHHTNICLFGPLNYSSHKNFTFVFLFTSLVKRKRQISSKKVAIKSQISKIWHQKWTTWPFFGSFFSFDFYFNNIRFTVFISINLHMSDLYFSFLFSHTSNESNELKLWVRG